jgi:hypothetical protein
VRVCFRFGDRRLFARLVRLLRGGDSAHCEVAGAWSEEIHWCVSASIQDGGVRAKEIRITPDKWRVYELSAGLDPHLYWLRNAGRRYDFLGLLGIVWPRLGHSRERRFCTEVAGEVLGLANPHLFDLRTLESVCATYGVKVI